MKGRAPIRRTIQYLNSGKLVLKDKIRIFSINYNTFGQHHDGARYLIYKSYINEHYIALLLYF
jgi:small subunit ribosomal protein S25